jgi:hypothetical protein
VSKLVGTLMFIAILVIYVTLFYAIIVNQPRTVMYNCSIAEISPDFPPKAREECRKIRAQQVTTNI